MFDLLHMPDLQTLQANYKMTFVFFCILAQIRHLEYHF